MHAPFGSGKRNKSGTHSLQFLGPLLLYSDHFSGGHHDSTSQGEGVVLEETLLLRTEVGEEEAVFAGVVGCFGICSDVPVFVHYLVLREQNSLGQKVENEVVGGREVHIPVESF